MTRHARGVSFALVWAVAVCALALTTAPVHAFDIKVDGPLGAWLSNITITIPPQNFTAGPYTFNVSNIMCDGIALGGLEGDVWMGPREAKRAVAAADPVEQMHLGMLARGAELATAVVAGETVVEDLQPEEVALVHAALTSLTEGQDGLNTQLNAYGLGVHCSADLDYYLTSLPRRHTTGNVSLTIGGDSHVGIIINISGENNTASGDGPHPPKVYTAAPLNCSVAVNVTELESTTPLIEAAAPALIAVIESAAPKALCGQMEKLVSVNLTNTLNDVAQAVATVLDNISSDNSDTVNYIAIVASFSGAVLVFLLIIAISEYVRWNRAAAAVDRADSEAMPILPEQPKVINSATPLSLEAKAHAQISLDTAGAHTASDTPQPNDLPLIHHPRISIYVRYAIVLVLLCNIALFISSNASVGASVVIYLTIGNNIHELPSLFAFTLMNSVEDMWKAGVYPLSILIAVFSGIWPYVKLLLMLACWVLPPRWLGIKSRETVLKVVDALGKWSLIDSYVLVLMIVAFRIHVGNQVAAFDLVVDVNFGFYTFLAATMLSLLSSHVAVYLHRHASNPPIPDSDYTEALCSHHFPTLRRGSAVRFTFLGKASVLLLLLSSALLMCIGGYVYSFDFTLGGYAATLLELFGQDTESPYSILSLAEYIPHATLNDPNNFFIRWIQFTFFGFSLAIPLGHLLAVALLWIVPMNPLWQHSYFVLVEVLNAWSAADVFVISIIAALLEIEQFAEFIVGDKCDPINQVVLLLFPEAGPDVTCFSVQAVLNNGCWILLSAVIVDLLVATTLMILCSKAIEERMERLRASSAPKLLEKDKEADKALEYGGEYQSLVDARADEDETPSGDAEPRSFAFRCLCGGLEWVALVLCSALQCIRVEKSTSHFLNVDEIFQD